MNTNIGANRDLGLGLCKIWEGKKGRERDKVALETRSALRLTLPPAGPTLPLPCPLPCPAARTAHVNPQPTNTNQNQGTANLVADFHALLNIHILLLVLSLTKSWDPNWKNS